MRRKYTYFPVQDGEDFLWVVHETATDQTMDTFFFEDDAIEFMEELENGIGFDGFTPTFILRKATPPVKDINAAFSAEFA